jgi:hypothetical protein
MSLSKSLVSQSLFVVSALTGLLGCQFNARSAKDYRDVTSQLLETRGAQIQSCYNDALKADASAKGSVVLHFNVAEDTGVLAGFEVQPESSAPSALSQCVVKSLEGLVLQPPDARKGDATFSWEFSAS